MVEKRPHLTIHRRSRFGCKQCKLRKVKCGNQRPSCTNCLRYGVDCNFLGPSNLVPRLQSQVSISRTATELAAFDISTTIARITGVDSLKDVSRLGNLFRNFRESTVLSIGSPSVAMLYQDQIPQLAFRHPYLMQTVLCLSALHQRVITGSRVTFEELQHSHFAISEFNRIISKPIPEYEQDAVFATATLLNTIFFASIEAVPSQTWPVNAQSLQWLRLQAGVALTIQAANPTRPGGLFADLFRHVEMRRDGPIPLLLRAMFKDDIYIPSIRLLAPLLFMDCSTMNVMYYLPFIGYMSTAMISLLEANDSRALLLLGLWFALVADSDQWWLKRRTDLELRSIEAYLKSRGSLTPSEVIFLLRQES